MCRVGTGARLPYVPQHFLNLRPLSQGQGSLRPTLGTSRINGVCGGQHVSSVQQGSTASVCSLKEGLFKFWFTLASYNSMLTTRSPWAVPK